MASEEMITALTAALITMTYNLTSKNEKAQEGKRPIQEYRRITRNETINRTMKRYNNNANSTEEEPKIKTDGEDGTTAQDQNPKEGHQSRRGFYELS